MRREESPADEDHAAGQPWIPGGGSVAIGRQDAGRLRRSGQERLGHGSRRRRRAASSIAADYLQALDDNKSVLVVSPTHAEAAAITREIRSVCEAGKLGAEEREFQRLVQVNTSEAERTQATTYRPGDVIQFHQNAKGGFVKGETVDHYRSGASAARPGREVFALPAGRGKAGGGRPNPVHRQRQGEPDRSHLQERRHAYRRRLHAAGNIRLSDGHIIAADAGHFRSAFVETSFGAQGQTVHRVILGMSAASLGASDMEQLYFGKQGQGMAAALHRRQGCRRSGGSTFKPETGRTRSPAESDPESKALGLAAAGQGPAASARLLQAAGKGRAPVPPRQPERQAGYGRG